PSCLTHLVLTSQPTTLLFTHVLRLPDPSIVRLPITTHPMPLLFHSYNFDNPHPVLHSPPMAKPALGRGLGALMGGAVGKAPTPTTPTTSAPATATAPAPAKPTGEQVQRIPVTRIVPCPFQPRKDFT